jgi:glycosyltransferase involved in cell wall biosynthesis
MKEAQMEVSARPPRVSAILTVYKRTEYLGEALDSVLAQSYPNYEVIIADDSGTAAAREIVETRARRDRRIRYRPNPRTLGVATSLAEAVKSARGEFIAVLNDDDLWEPDLLAELAAPLEADPGLVLAASDHWIMDTNGRIDVRLSESWSADFGRASLPKGIVTNPAEFVVLRGGPAINISSLFRKDAVDWSLLVPEVAGAYDYWISCLLAATGKPIYYVPRRLARWRVHSKMETHRRSHDKGENLVYIFSTMRERSWFPELDAVLREKLAEALFAVGRDKLHFDRAREARRYMWRSFLLSWRLKAALRAAAACLPRNIRSRLGICLGIVRKWHGAAAPETRA